MTNKFLNCSFVFSVATTTLYANQEVYIVKKGDTLGGIAEQYGISSRELKRLNPTKITNRNLIYPGMELVVPNSLELVDDVDIIEDEVLDDTTISETYIVKKGDTLGGIAEKYGVSSRELKKLNPTKITDRNLIYPGMKLVVPISIEESVEVTSTENNDNKEILKEIDNITTSEKEIAVEEVTAEKDATEILETSTYIVQKGDTLGGIAEQYGVSSRELKRLNSTKITDRNLIYPGMKLAVPSIVEIVERKNIIKDENSGEILETSTYIVQKGDTLGGIAEKYGVSSRELKRLNPTKIIDRNLIYPGMKLIVPELIDDIEVPTEEQIEVPEEETLVSRPDTNIESDSSLNQIQAEVIQSEQSSIENSGIQKQENKILKIELAPDSHIEIYYEGKVVGYKTAKDKEIINVQGDTIKLGNKLKVKSYHSNGDIKEKEVKITNKQVTLITFIDNNSNKDLDLSDTLITIGNIEIGTEKENIDSLGRTKFNNLEIGKSYDVILNSEEQNIVNKKINIKINGDRVYLPIENEVYAVKGHLNINLKGIFAKQNKYKKEDILIRIKNDLGNDIALVPVDKDGNFYIEGISKGTYFCDIEYINSKGLDVIYKNYKINITNGTLELNIEKKEGFFSF